MVQRNKGMQLNCSSRKKWGLGWWRMTQDLFHNNNSSSRRRRCALRWLPT
jgi:hypothetical protein